MHKLWIITLREYMTRVRSKSFLLSTFLAPLSMIAFIVVVSLIFRQKSDKEKAVVIKDDHGILDRGTSKIQNLTFEFSDKDIESLKEDYKQKKYDGILILDSLDSPTSEKYDVTYISDDLLGFDEQLQLEHMIGKNVRASKLKSLQLNQNQIDQLDTDITINPETISTDEKGEKKKVSNYTTLVASGLGLFVGFLMFIMIMLYGNQVMRSVMEEKINRIVEVMISSVKPLELMGGKIIGSCLVGFTQILAWVVLLGIGYFILFNFFGDSLNLTSTANLPTDELPNEAMSFLSQTLVELQNLNWVRILGLSFVYFILGYLLYASLFAALGAAIGDDMYDAQTLTIPITMPIAISYYIGFSAAQSPNTSLAEWASMIPFSAPIVMPVRLAYDPPTWQIAVSLMGLLITSFLTIWLAAKIYRTGILLYGKKASFAEIGKWLFKKT